MMTKTAIKNREQVEFICLDDLVPKRHPVRKLEAAADWDFIYDLVKDKYSSRTGRPSLDPVILVKLPLLQQVFGLRSMQQTLRETEVNMAYRWFLGLNIHASVPHISTFRRNYARCFGGTDLFEQISGQILREYAKSTRAKSGKTQSKRKSL